MDISKGEQLAQDGPQTHVCVSVSGCKIVIPESVVKKTKKTRTSIHQAVSGQTHLCSTSWGKGGDCT